MANADLIRDLLHYIDALHNDDCTIGASPNTVKDRVDDLGLPADLCGIIKHTWFAASLEERHSLYGLQELLDNQDQEQCLKQGFLNIGSCYNGDLILLQTASPGYAVYFGSYDHIWSPGESDISQASILVCDRLEDFLFRIAETRFIPTDSYSAQGFVEMLRRVNGPIN